MGGLSFWSRYCCRRRVLEPSSVVDVGCGIGTWLKVFSDNGIFDYIGIDGDYVDKNLLKIDKKYFVDYKLETYYHSEIKFDLAISLEVAEHLKEESANEFIKTLTDISYVVIFSAAIPNQGGQNHLNEREPLYWITKFENFGFECFDVLRPVFWDNKNIDCWYRQNTFLFTRNNELKDKLKCFNSFYNAHLVHPDLLKIKENYLNSKIENEKNIINGKKSRKFYLKLFMSLINRINFFK